MRRHIAIEPIEQIVVSNKLLVIILCLSSLISSACVSPAEKDSLAATKPPTTPTPTPAPLVAYLKEGGLWVVYADGGGERQLVAPPEGAAINDHVWSNDGSRIYYSVGTRYFSCPLAEVNGEKVREAGELAAPEGATIDRLELGRDGKTLIAHAIGQNAELNAPPKVYATEIGRHEARELSVDEYSALAPPQPVVVRGFEDLSVSPDSRYVLFKEAVGDFEQLFVADIETGARYQISNLSAIEGFEPSADLTGGRRLLEATWSPDGRFVIFNPAQSCSDVGLCYGQLFLTDIRGGVQYQLTREMAVSIPLEWRRDGKMLAYDDGGQIVVADTEGQIRRLAEGNRPKFQPQW